MRLFQSLRRRLRSYLDKNSSNVQLGEELQFHLERQTEENIAHGMSPKEARSAAKASFGDLPTAIEECYEARGVAWLDDLAQDVRYGLRAMVKYRSFTVVTVFTLALGIGACTAIFSLVNAVLIQSLPYGEPDRLVYAFTPNPLWNLPGEVFGPSDADFFDLKKQSRSFSATTLFAQTTYNLAGNDRAERVGAAEVDADFFRTLEVAPELGRGFDQRDEQPGNDHVAVISHALWLTVLGGHADVLGSTLSLDGVSYQVIGMMPEEFRYPQKSDLAYGNGHVETTDVWVPSALTPRQKADREASNGYALARLRPGVSVREAQAEMDTIMSHLNLLHNPDTRGWGAFVKPFRDSALGQVRPLMWLLMGTVGFVMLIACGNAANLLLARAAARSHELGVRATLGARRSRLMRQMLTESLMLSAAAGTVGVGLAWLFLHALLKLNPGDIPRMDDALIDLRVMGFAVFVTMLTSVIFGMLPSLSATRINLVEFLKSSGMRGVAGDRKRVRHGLAVAQIALLVVLLTGTGLLLRSYANVLSVPTGFSATTVTASVQMSSQYGNAHKRRAFFGGLIERINSIPGMQAVGVVNELPLSNSESLASLFVEGYPNTKQQLVEERGITQNYLSAMQTPLVEGRDISDEDAAGNRLVAVVNQAFVKKYFANGDAIGHRIRTGEGESGPWVTVVGVAKDVRYMSLEAAPVPQVYRSFWQMEWNESNIVGAYVAVRSSLPQDGVVAEIRTAVKGIDPSLAVADVHTMSELVSSVTARRRFQTTLLTVFSVTAMLLAMVGVYGLLTYSVRQRTGEIGIRLALGSSKNGVVRLILREGLTLLGIGLVIGLAVALACTRLLTGFLYGVPALDPATFAMVPMLLLAATIAACLIPSFRAAAIDPINALRHE
ncbi:ABC transporter permease [Tunturiibacter gelidoferens]|uniref:ABC transporter permease n=1 Tax=Tunturiibacter gelidiferens TaxID=3069689 RepID=A0AAU7YUF7_9BACT